MTIALTAASAGDLSCSQYSRSTGKQGFWTALWPLLCWQRTAMPRADRNQQQCILSTACVPACRFVRAAEKTSWPARPGRQKTHQGRQGNLLVLGSSCLHRRPQQVPEHLQHHVPLSCTQVHSWQSLSASSAGHAQLDLVYCATGACHSCRGAPPAGRSSWSGLTCFCALPLLPFPDRSLAEATMAVVSRG